MWGASRLNHTSASVSAAESDLSYRSGEPITAQLQRKTALIIKKGPRQWPCSSSFVPFWSWRSMLRIEGAVVLQNNEDDLWRHPFRHIFLFFCSFLILTLHAKIRRALSLPRTMKMIFDVIHSGISHTDNNSYELTKNAHVSMVSPRNDVCIPPILTYEWTIPFNNSHQIGHPVSAATKLMA